jgi:N6-adenosine-specific RNA methylase IME4
LADPPWRFRNYSAKGERKNPIAHYDCLSLDEIEALPVSRLAAPDCVLVLWATWPFLPQALKIMEVWGFTYKTGGAWAKQSKTGRCWAFGTGYILRSACEPFLIGTTGQPTRRAKNVRNLVVAPVREHSCKPEEFFAQLERLFDAPRCELFARERRPGWHAWGQEVEKFTPVPVISRCT